MTYFENKIGNLKYYCKLTSFAFFQFVKALFVKAPNFCWPTPPVVANTKQNLQNAPFFSSE